MYSLISGLYQYLTLKEEYNILILGLDNAGKTTLIEMIKSIFLGVPTKPPERIIPTVGLNIGKIPIGNSKAQFWDLGGQTDLRTLWEKYFEECHGIVFVVDSQDKDRMEECQHTFETLVSNQAIISVPILVLANKQDQPDAMPVHQIKEIFNRIAVRLSVTESSVQRISALQGDGVKEAVEWLHVRVKHNRDQRPPNFA